MSARSALRRCCASGRVQANSARCVSLRLDPVGCGVTCRRPAATGTHTYTHTHIHTYTHTHTLPAPLPRSSIAARTSSAMAASSGGAASNAPSAPYASATSRRCGAPTEPGSSSAT
eukprot:5928132-Prymnesium_polylepis.1